MLRRVSQSLGHSRQRRGGGHTAGTTTTETPTYAPTETSTDILTDAPTDIPTDAPTETPTNAPKDAPTDAPTSGSAHVSAIAIDEALSSWEVIAALTDELITNLNLVSIDEPPYKDWCDGIAVPLEVVDTALSQLLLHDDFMNSGLILKAMYLNQ